MAGNRNKKILGMKGVAKMCLFCGHGVVNLIMCVCMYRPGLQKAYNLVFIDGNKIVYSKRFCFHEELSKLPTQKKHDNFFVWSTF
jgi:hypothetical protein